MNPSMDEGSEREGYGREITPHGSLYLVSGFMSPEIFFLRYALGFFGCG